MMQYAFISAYFLAAIIIPLTFVFMLVGVFRVTSQKNNNFFWGWLIAILGIIPVLTDIRTPRSENIEGVQGSVWTPPGFIQFFAEWGSRGLIYIIIGYAVVIITKTILSNEIEKRDGKLLFASYIALITPSFISALAGTRPEFSHFMTYAPLIFTLAYLIKPSTNWLDYVKQFKRILFIYISLSAIFGILAPSWATGSALTLIPGFNFRLHGIFSHSNILGVAALIYLVLDLSEDRRLTIYRASAWVISTGVLIATQSKTNWAGLAIAYTIFYIYKISTITNENNEKSRLLLIVIGIFTITVLAAFIAFGTTGLEKTINSFDSNTYKSISSLTGRTNIWDITIKSWQENPIFGYGPGLWDVEYRLHYAPQYLLIVGMAHNQFFQTLGESGILGVIGLFTYTGTLITFGFRYFSTTRGTSLALVSILIIRSVSETPFRNISIDLLFFIHFAVFVLFVSLEANSKNKNRAA